MKEPIDLAPDLRGNRAATEPREGEKLTTPAHMPSNPVYARVGETVRRAVQDGIRRGLPPQDIIREIVAEHKVHMTVGDLRLLLATRPRPDKNAKH